MNNHIQLILLIILFKIYFIICQDACSPNCVQCSNKKCTKCDENFLLNNNNQTCYPQCSFGQSYDFTTLSCQPICPHQYFSNSETQSCEQYLPCPKINEFGQDYFDSFSKIVVTHNGKILVTGKNNNQNSQTIKILDNQNYILQGYLKGHSDGVVNINYYHLNYLKELGNNQSSSNDSKYLKRDQNTIDGEEILVTLSKTQLILWDLNYNQILYKITFPNYIISFEKLTFITKDFIIIMKNDENLTTFGVIYMNDITSQSIYKQQTSPILIESSYKIFKQVHQKKINGILILQDNKILSYCSESKIILWNSVNSPNDYNIICELKQEIIFIVQISNNFFIIHLKQSNSLYIFDGQKCKEMQTSHSNSIDWVSSSSSTDEQGFTYFFSCSSNEIIFYFYEEQDIDLSPLPAIQKDNTYRFIVDDKLVIISYLGYISVYKFNSINGLQLIYYYDLQLKVMNQINDAFINNSGQDLILVGSDLLVFKFNTLPVGSNKLPIPLVNTDKKKNISKQMRQHTSQVNGILFDRLYDRIITYSTDGSFKIWEERILENQGQMTDYRLIFEQYHPSCNMLLDRICSRQLVKMDILLPQLFYSQYNDNTVILWNYFSFSVTINQQLALSNKNLNINNYQFYKNSLLLLNNQQQISIFNILTNKQIFQYQNFNFFYAVIDEYFGYDYISAVIYQPNYIIIISVDSQQIVRSVQHDGGLGFAKYITQIKYTFASSLTANKFYVFNFLLSKAVAYTINQPVSISIDIISRNFLIFSKNFDVSYFYWDQNGGLNWYSTQYTFASIIPQNLIATLSNPEQHFFVQNTAFSEIKNQVHIILCAQNYKYNFNVKVISLGPRFENFILLTFEDKISSIALDPNTNKFYLGFQNGKIYSGGYQTRYFAYQDQSQLIQGMYYYEKLHSIFAFNKFIHQIDIRNMNKTKIYLKAHEQYNITDIIIDDQNQWIISYNNDTDTNFYRWDLNGEGVSQFKGGQLKEIIKVFLDISSDRIISYSTDLTFLVWSYKSQKKLFYITSHITQKVIYDEKFKFIPLDQRIPYKIISYFHDIQNKRIISINNNENLFVHYYQSDQNSQPQTEEYNIQFEIKDMVDLYIDMVAPYQRIYVKVFSEYVYSLRTYTFLTIEFQQQLSYHNSEIIGMKFINNYSYSFELQKIVIMDRKSLNKIREISSQNPEISNFIVFEKMDHIYLFCELTPYTPYSSYRLAIHRHSTGALLKQILNSQFIESGNIHRVFLDEENYQLLIYKSLYQNIFTVDVRTFQYTSYFTLRYAFPLINAIFIKENNLLVQIDSLNLQQSLILSKLQQITSHFIIKKLYSKFLQENKSDYYYNQVFITLFKILNLKQRDVGGTISCKYLFFINPQ